jgi:hypothetical protein
MQNFKQYLLEQELLNDSFLKPFMNMGRNLALAGALVGGSYNQSANAAPPEHQQVLEKMTKVDIGSPRYEIYYQKAGNSYSFLIYQPASKNQDVNTANRINMQLSDSATNLVLPKALERLGLGNLKGANWGSKNKTYGNWLVNKIEFTP